MWSGLGEKKDFPMPLAYSITAADVVQTDRLDAASSKVTADAQAILETEQESLETGIRPEFLSDLRFRPLIRAADNQTACG